MTSYIENQIKHSELRARILEKKHEKALTEKDKERENAIRKNFANLQNASKPILDTDLFERVNAGLVAHKKIDVWKKWGFTSANTVMLFDGPSGTGKTTTARWMAKSISVPLLEISMGSIGGGNPGDTERSLRENFAIAQKYKAIIFLDECDALLWDRGRVGGDSMWMLGVINSILTLIEQYEGIIVLATNNPAILDPALARRLTEHITFREPSIEIRKKLWAAKWPAWPLALPTKGIKELAKYKINGNAIEKVIQAVGRLAILRGIEPTFANLQETAAEYERKMGGSQRGYVD